MSGGFFRGTSADQDTRFSNKQAKLLKSQKFAPELDHLVDMSKVKMDIMRPWIATRVTELLGFEDEVLLNFIYTLLEGKEVNGKEVQIALTGFMEKNTGRFMKELWMLLLSAQNTGSGIPQQFLDAKREELEKKQVDDHRIKNEIQKKEESKEVRQERSKKMDNGIGTKFSSPDVELAFRSLQRKGSSDNSGDDKEAVKRNGLRGRNRISQSPNSADRLAPSPRGSPTRSGRSLSCSRSYSGQRSRSVSRSPRMRRSSISPRGRSISPQNRRPGISLSPSRRRQSYSRRRSRSPSSSRSPPMQHRLGSYRRRSPSPIRRRLPSPRHRRSPSPLRSRRTPSPVRRRRSPSPIRRRRSPSPIRRRRSPLPIRHRRSPSPARHYRSPSPVRRRRTPPPVRSYRSRSPVRRHRSPSPIQHRSPPRIRHSSPSPTYHRSPSPRRMLGSADHGLSSPMRHGSRYSPHHDSLTSKGGKSRLLQRRSVSPYQRRHQRSSSTPGSRSASPMLSRSPPHRRPTPHDRSASPYGSSSPSPVRHTSSSMKRISPKENRKSPKKIRKSPQGTSGERVRTREDLFPALHRPSSPLRSAHKESNDLASKCPKSPTPVKTKGPIEDGSPYGSPIGQSGRRLVLDDSTSKKSRELKPRQDSPVTSEEEDTKYIRERRVPKSKSSQNPSSRTTVVSEQKDSHVGVHTKTEKSSKGGLNIHHDQSEKSSERGVHSFNSDEKDRRKSSNIKADHALHGSDVMVSAVEKVDHSNGRVALNSDPDEGKKHRGESKEKKRQRRSHRREVSSEDDESCDSEIEDRKEAKRRRKEEKKLRKEEKRRRREERRRRKEARRAEKLKLNDDNSSDSDDVGKGKSHRSDNEDAQDEQKKLEVELRKKALELYQAKKRSSR